MSIQALRSASILSGVSTLLLLVACGGKQNAPTPPVSAAVQPGQPLIVQGQVVNGATGKAISGAKVNITRPDGTWLASLASASDGTFGLDVSAEPSTELKVEASAEGYGFTGTLAQLSKATNSSRVPDLRVSPIQPAQQTVGATGATVIASAVKEAPAGAQLSATLPAGALIPGAAVALAPLASADVQPHQDAAQHTLAAFRLETHGQALSRPADITCPLPFQATPGRSLTAYRLDAATGRWTAVPEAAVVNPDGLTARLAVNQEGTYSLTDAVTFQVAEATGLEATTLVSPGQTQMFSLAKGSMIARLENEVNVTYLVKTGSVPMDEWLTNLLKLSLGESRTYTVRYRLNFPTLPSQYQSGGLQVNPSRPGEAGYWEYRWYFESYAMTPKVATIGYPPFFTVKVRVDETRWRETAQSGWYWQIIVGPTGGVGL